MNKGLLALIFAANLAVSVYPDTLEAVQSPTSEPSRPDLGYVLIIIPQYNFVDNEYSIPKVTISRAGYTVEVASTSTKEIALGADIMKVRPNLTIEQINVDKYQAVVFVGGYMSKKFFENKVLIEKAKEFNDKGKLIGAMDNIPYFMAQWGMLKDVKVTVNKTLAKAIKSMNINYSDKDIIIDQNFITVNMQLYSDAFATEFVSELNKRTGK
jgi:putative intracellular protease/amidase